MANKKQLTYEERLKQSASEKEQANVKFDVADAKLEIKGERNKTERKVAQLERELEDAKSSKKFDLARILQAKADYDAWTKRLADLNEIEKELGLES